MVGNVTNSVRVGLRPASCSAQCLNGFKEILSGVAEALRPLLSWLWSPLLPKADREWLPPLTTVNAFTHILPPLLPLPAQFAAFAFLFFLQFRHTLLPARPAPHIADTKVSVHANVLRICRDPWAVLFLLLDSLHGPACTPRPTPLHSTTQRFCILSSQFLAFLSLHLLCCLQVKHALAVIDAQLPETVGPLAYPPSFDIDSVREEATSKTCGLHLLIIRAGWILTLTCLDLFAACGH